MNIDDLTKMLADTGLVERAERKPKPRAKRTKRSEFEMGEGPVVRRSTRNARLNDLPLEKTPSAADEDGKILIRHMKKAINAHRRIRLELKDESGFMQDMLMAKALVSGPDFDAKLKLNKDTLDEFMRMHVSIQYVAHNFKPYQVAIETMPVPNPDVAMSISRLRSYLIKHEAELKAIFNDDIKYFPHLEGLQAKTKATKPRAAPAQVRVKKIIGKKSDVSKIKKFDGELDDLLQSLNALKIRPSSK